jgi:hypothetical protein
MVTSHQQPDPRVRRPGWESNSVRSLSRKEAAIQTQAHQRTVFEIETSTGILGLVGRMQSCEGAYGPLLRGRVQIQLGCP